MKLTKQTCDALWSKCIRELAGNKSELSGKTERLNAHHIKGKGNLALRYSLLNGICLTVGEHFFTAHRQDRQDGFNKRVEALRGRDIWKKLDALKRCKGKKLSTYYLILEEQLYLIKSGKLTRKEIK